MMRNYPTKTRKPKSALKNAKAKTTQSKPTTYEISVNGFKRLTPKIVTVYVGQNRTETTFPIKDPNVYITLARILNDTRLNQWFPFIFTIDAEKGYLLHTIPQRFKNKEETPKPHEPP